MTVMLSSQGIGLITAIAVSGCSVMLLVLGRQRLLELKKESSCLQAKVSQEGGLISHSSEHHPQKQAMGGAAISWSLMNSDKKRNLVKKVRFSEDVVEPSGDNVAYRRRHALVLKSGQPRSQKPDSTCCRNKGVDKPINYSKSDANRRRVETKIPGNRMALYIGICNDRSRRALLH